MSKRQANSQRGFTLVEIMLVILILTIVMGVIFTDINTVQKRYRTEEAKLDVTQESREFLDQIVRDLRQTGFPGTKLYTYNVLAPNNDQDPRAAVGLVYAGPNDLVFEADVDGSGTVWSVRYTLVAGAGGNCPCSIQRSQVPKVAGDPRPATLGGAQGTTYNVELQNILNSNGLFAIAGLTRFPSGGMQTNDALYGAYKVAPVFQYFDANGANITGLPYNAVLPLDATVAANRTIMKNIREVQVNLNVLSPTSDLQTGMRPAVSMTATARLTN